MGQVIRLEAAEVLGCEIARRAPTISAPGAHVAYQVTQALLAEMGEKANGRLRRGLEEFDWKDRELKRAVLRAFNSEREAMERGQAVVARPDLEKLCVRCEENEAAVKLIATDLGGTVLDGPERVCRSCAADAGFQVGA